MKWIRLLLLLVFTRPSSALGQPPIAQLPTEPRSQKTAARVDVHGDPLPQGAIARLGTIRFRNGLFKPHFLPDGKSFMTASREALQFWETATGRLLREIPSGNLRGIHRIALSQDGKLAAAIGQGARVWDVSSGKEIQSFATDRRSPADNVAFSRDNNFLISSQGGIVRIDEIATGKEFRRHDFKSRILVNFAVSPDGATLAVAARESGGTVFMWQWTRPDDPRPIKVPAEHPYVVSFSPDGKLLAFSDQMGDSIHLWDIGGDRLLRTISMKDKKLCCSHLAFSPDAKILAITDSGNRKSFSGGLYLFDLKHHRHLAEWLTPGVQVMWATVSPDARWIAATTSGGVRVWQWPSGKPVADVEEAHRGLIHVLVSSGDFIVSGGADNTVRVWDAATGKQTRRLDHGGDVRAAALSRDGAKLFTSSLDDQVRLWDLKTGTEVKRLPGHGRLGGLRVAGFSLDGQCLLSWGDGRALRTWEASTGKLLSEHEVPPRDGKKIVRDGIDGDVLYGLFDAHGARFSADGKHLVFPYLDHLHVFETATGRRSQMIRFPVGRLNDLAVSSDCRSAIASFTIGQAKAVAIVVWELTSGRLRKSFITDEAGAGYGHIAVSGNDALVAVSAWTAPDKVRVFSLAKGDVLATYEGLPNKATQLAFAPDGRYLITAHRDSALVWKPRWPASRIEHLSLELTNRRWDDLAGDDAAKAYEAIDALARSPDATVKHLQSRLKPAIPPDPARVAQLIHELNSDRFEVRDKARRELEIIRDFIVPEVKAALAKNPPLEAVRRLEGLLGKIGAPLTASKELQEARALEVLERIASADARQLLERLARGPAAARLTQDARATLIRLGHSVPSS